MNWTGQLPQDLRERERRRAAFMAVAEAGVGGSSSPEAPRRGHASGAGGPRAGVGPPWWAEDRSYADAPEIDGLVQLLPPEKASTCAEAWESLHVRALLTSHGHDLVADPL
jgi:ribosomal protein S12 methylthiotransferase